MLSTITYTLRELVRNPGIMVWSLLFPLILMTLFSMMFGPLDEMGEQTTVRAVVVRPDDSADGQAFSHFIEAVSEGEDPLLSVTYADSAEEAARMLASDAQDDADAEDEPPAGFVELVNGKPNITLMERTSLSSMATTYASVLMLVTDEYTAQSALIKSLIEKNPAALASGAVADALSERVDATRQMDVTVNQPKESLRYYFALLGMAALFGGTVSLVAFQRIKPNISALGARRSVGGLSHGRTVAATLIACWLVNFACLTVAYLAMRFVFGIDFAGRDGACLAVVATASFTALCLGCAVNAIPHVPEQGKSGILTGIVCFSALFAGLYGQPTMQLADMIAQACPAVAWVNPASQIAEAFYSIMYYDNLAPLLSHLLALAAMGLVLLGLSVGSLRRQRYASL